MSWALFSLELLRTLLRLKQTHENVATPSSTSFQNKKFSGVPENYIPLITATTPDVIVETVDQEHLILRYVSQYWNVVINLVIGQPVEADLLGFGVKKVSGVHSQMT